MRVYTIYIPYSGDTEELTFKEAVRTAQDINKDYSDFIKKKVRVYQYPRPNWRRIEREWTFYNFCEQFQIK